MWSKLEKQEYSKKYYQKNKIKLDKLNKEYCNTHKEQIKKRRKEYSKKHYQLHKQEKSEYGRKYFQKNKRKILDKFLKKKKEDPNVLLAANLRGRLSHAIKENSKSGSAVSDLGCTIEQLKQKFELMFYPHPDTGEIMSWKNYGYYGWHIDHIAPLCNFDLTDKEQFKKACHYTNLQPMWSKQNMSKGPKRGNNQTKGEGK